MKGYTLILRRPAKTGKFLELYRAKGDTLVDVSKPIHLFLVYLRTDKRITAEFIGYALTRAEANVLMLPYEHEMSLLEWARWYKRNRVMSNVNIVLTLFFQFRERWQTRSDWGDYWHSVGNHRYLDDDGFPIVGYELADKRLDMLQRAKRNGITRLSSIKRGGLIA